MSHDLRGRDRAADARVRAIFDEAASLHAQAGAAAPLIVSAAELMISALQAGRKILLFGNGGSAADAQHAAAELVGRFQLARPALAALALTTDTSVLTSIANDFAYEDVFVRQIEALGAPGDVAFGISTSGRSPNVLRALETARARALRTIALVGADGSLARQHADLVIGTQTSCTARVQELHRTTIHAICDIVESRAADGKGTSDATTESD